METIHAIPVEVTDTKGEAAPEVAPSPPRQIPAPGQPMSFEDAKKMAFKRYDNALRELAK